jgi:catechol 2,3-dioxygenase-like lactoylglutathione lyase family enzyme
VELVEVVVYTRDMARATAFYRDTLGLEPDYESEHWTTFRTGACTLACTPDRKHPTQPSRSPIWIRSVRASPQRASR